MIDHTLFGNIDVVQDSIDLLRELEPPEGYWLAYSGGKDSEVIIKLADMAEVKYDAHYNLTTIDPPEIIYHIREHHPEVIIDKPEMPFLKMLVKKGFPQRKRRWCCAKYKEKGGTGRYVVTGIRWEESQGRKNREQVETCYNDMSKQFVHPIIGWTEIQVWRFIRKYNLPYCKLYDEGWKRVGCLFCPMAGYHRKMEVELYPKYTQAFIRAFRRCYDAKKAKGLTSVDRWKDGEEMFWWWINEDRRKENKIQVKLDFGK